MDNRIPAEYQNYWKPFRTKAILHHLTTVDNVAAIMQHGIESRDPSPKYWAGIAGIWMSYPRDPLYKINFEHIRAHVKVKGETLVRLHIRTRNDLFRSTDPQRTNQVLTLDPILPKDIVKVEQHA
jgi:hypothetical protein